MNTPQDQYGRRPLTSYLDETSGPRRRRRSTYDVRHGWWSVRRLVALAVLATVVLGGAYGGVIVYKLAKTTGSNPLSIISRSLGMLPHPGGAEVDSFPRTTIALFGYGGGNHDGAYLSDSILVLTMQKSPGKPIEAAEISAPRDWYVPTDMGNGKTHYGKINEAYEIGQTGLPEKSDVYTGPKGGGAQASHVLEQLLGIHIDHWVGVDFHAFQALVDAVGGIEVNVPNAFTDSQYPAGDCTPGFPGSNCGFWTIHFDAGLQHMTGQQALIFARSRHSNDNNEGTDFARSRRQQLIVQALKAKTHSVNIIAQAPSLIDALGADTITDMSFDDETRLYGEAKSLDAKSIKHISLDDQNFLYDSNPNGGYYLFAHDKSYHSLQHYIQSALPDQSAIAENAAVTISDGSGRGQDFYGNTASSRWSGLMNAIGFTTTDGGPVPRARTTQVIDNSGGRDARTAQWFATYYGVQVTPGSPPAPATGAPPAVGGVSVILGQDEENAFNALRPDVEQSGDGGTGTLGYYGNGGSNTGNTYNSGYNTYPTPYRYQRPCYLPYCRPRR
ncbi:MAG: LCP family protein [Candidatus Dormibacteria bacterium]